MTDPGHNRVFRIRNGILETVVGNGLNDGLNAISGLSALDTRVSFPRSAAFDSKGNLYVPDTSHYLWRVTPAGIAEIVAGNGNERFSGDGGPARLAEVGHLNYVAVDAGDNVYFIDWSAARIRRIDTNGIVSTVVGTGTYGFSGDGGPATSARFNLVFPDNGGLAIDRDGNLLLLDHDNQRIRRIDRNTQVITTVIGPTVNGQRMDNMRSMAVSPSNEIYFTNAAVIYRRAADGAITQLSNGTPGFTEDGGAFATAKLSIITAMTFDRSGNLYFTDDGVHRVRTVDTTGKIVTVAGLGPGSLGEGGPAIAAALLGAGVDLDFLPSGELAISDVNRLHKIDGNGNLVRFAGSGLPSPIEGVPAAAASINPSSVSVKADGTVDMAGNIAVYRIDPDGIVRHVAGKPGKCDFSGDGGPAVDAGLCQAFDARRDAQGNLFIADSNNNRVRRVDHSTGVITTIVGSGPVNGLERYGFGTTCGDGGPATAACINTPYGLAFDDDGNLYIEENEHNVRKVDRAGIITTLAQVGGTKLRWAFGNLFMIHGNALSRVSPTGLVTQLTANGIGFSGDGGPVGKAHVQTLGQSDGVAVDAEGNLYFSDGNNLRVRAVRYGAVLAPPGSIIEASASGSIHATVFDSRGDRAAGVRVEFSVPSSGPSCTPSSPFAITDRNGEITVSCASNCINGSYAITALLLGTSTTTSVGMTNSGPCGRRRSARH